MKSLLITTLLTASIALQAQIHHGNSERITIEKQSDDITIVKGEYYYTYTVLLIQIDKATGYPEYYPYWTRSHTLYKQLQTRDRNGYKYVVHITAVRYNEVFELITEI